ncbi:hypothetical protein Leryth_017384 [Lithospermum erythrorhizon]|nr:hypothetical protein Leryth_017384 [Lithospermum erythrorhizon]
MRSADEVSSILKQGFTPKIVLTTYRFNSTEMCRLVGYCSRLIYCTCLYF